MELVCALVLTFVSLVSSTPHGYGVKGGAIAKADARAVAGAFGGDSYGAVPLSIPNGAGYSGSYSKSSASSFASSSASASSFSYSGSGSLGANGLPGSSFSGNAECTSGSCGVSGENGTPISHGAPGGNGLVSGAKATSVAGAVGIVGSPAYSENGNQAPCISGDCSKKSQSNCEGSNCDGHSLPSGTSSAIYDSKIKCSTGQCGQTSSSPAYETNDIPVSISGSAGSKSSYNSDNKSSKDDKTPPGFIDVESSGATASAQNQPSTYLTAPKLGAACTSPNCKSPTESAYENLPSSYNVPIHGTYPSSSSQEKGPCISGNCGTGPSNAPGSTYQRPSAPSNSGSCTTGDCGVYSPSTPKTQSNYPVTSPTYSSKGPSVSSDCGTTNCGGISSNQPSVITSSTISKYPSGTLSGTLPNTAFSTSGATAGANALPGSYSAPKPTGTSSTNPKLPPYTGGFGGPPGFLKPNDFNIPVSSPLPSFVPLESHTPVPCSSGNCGSAPSQSKPTFGHSSFPNKPTSPAGVYNPTSCTAGNCGTPQIHHIPTGSPKPTLPAGGFGGPTGILTPSTGSSAPTGPSACSSGTCGPQQDFSSPESGSPTGNQYKPTAPVGTYNPSSCSFGNCGNQPVSSSSQYNPSEPSKPIVPGFGAPAGVLKPNEFDSPSNVPASNYKPTTPGGNSACSSGNCGSQLGFSSPNYDQSGSPSASHYKPTIPSGSNNQAPCSSGECGNQPSLSLPKYSPSGQTKPTVPVSGFGTPPGVLAPNNVPTINYKPSGPTSPQNTVLCSFGNCGPQSGQASSSFTIAPQSSFNPSTCTSGNCEPLPRSTSSQHGQSDSLTGTQYKQTGPYNSATSCLSGNCGSEPGPSPGFSQSSLPSGAQQKPLAPAGTSNPFCTTGNCGSLSEHSTSQYGQSGAANTVQSTGYSQSSLPIGAQQKPLAPLATAGTSNPTCTTGNCGSIPEHSTSQYGQSGAANSGQSTGYGQSSLPSGAQQKPLAPAGIFNPSCPSGNCGSLPGYSTSQYSQSGAVIAGQSPGYSQSSLPSGAQQKPLAPAGIFNPSCPFGNCGSLPAHSTSQYGQSGAANAANAFTGAVASANAVTYTGGFGGPPGILTPFDNGKIVTTGTTSFSGKFPVTSQLGAHHGLAPSAINTSYGKSFNGVSTGTLSGAGAQASAVAGATAGVYGGGNHLNGYNNQGSNHGSDSHTSGCNGGCDASGGGIEASNIDLINALRAGSAAKSLSGSYGQGGSFASSSASAHATAGSAVKGGYGR